MNMTHNKMIRGGGILVRHKIVILVSDMCSKQTQINTKSLAVD